MAIAMSFVMSLVQTIARLGFVPNLASAWLTSFAIGVTVAIPTAIIVAPPRSATDRQSHRRAAPLTAGESPVSGPTGARSQRLLLPARAVPLHGLAASNSLAA